MITLVPALILVGLDQLTKYLARTRLLLGESVTLCPGFFNLTHVRNTGAVWGTLQHQNAWLALFSLIALALIAIFYHRADLRRAHKLALGLMLGGVIGNLIDRIRLGWVVDFLDFYWRGWHWPTFNLADAAISVGVVVYMISVWHGERVATPAKG
ncbi:MAG: signal peptidase II [Kiritimatiellia bacterium]